jgi:hypothetical protein
LAKRERPFIDYPYLIALEKTNGVTNLGNSYGTDRAAAIFTDYIGTVIKNKLTECLKNCRFYCVLCDGSTDSAVSEQELIYILYLKDGSPKVEFLSIETAENSNAVGLKKCITDAFTRVGITDSYKHLLGVNLDGANVNLGAYAGLGALLKEGSPWLEVVHCFNHQLELALKDAFENLSAFKTVDELLLQLYYLYQKSPKRYRELQGLAEAWGNSVPKPTKACGTRWIDHKYKAMKIALENYGVLMTHIESLAITDSQIAKRAELKGFLKRWKNASVPINLSIYLDVLSPLRRLSLSFQNNIHDPV